MQHAADALHRILSKLLAAPFTGSAVLQAQLAEAEFSRLTTDAGDPSLAIAVNTSRLADVLSRVPVEGNAPDEDGVQIHFLVHVVAGKLNELEVYREDLKSILRLPEASALVVIINE